MPSVDGDGSILTFSLLSTSVFPDSISYAMMSECSESFRIASGIDFTSNNFVDKILALEEL